MTTITSLPLDAPILPLFPVLSRSLSLSHHLCRLCVIPSGTVPRSFRLRQELEYAEKGASMESKSNQAAASNKPKDPHAVFVSFGLGDLDETGYDNQLSNWNGTIIGPQNVHHTPPPVPSSHRRTHTTRRPLTLSSYTSSLSSVLCSDESG